jgi:lactoylglutathione lyase
MNNIEWVLLITDRYEESKLFYKDIVELPVVREVAEEQFVQFKMKHGFLALYGRKEVEKLLGNAIKGTGGGAIYSFAEVDDVDETYRKLKEKGVQFVKDPALQPWGQKTAYFTDPDGHIWEIQKWEKKL